MQIKQENLFLTLLLILYLLCFLLPIIKSQEIQISKEQKYFKEITDNFNQTEKIFDNLTKKIKENRFNFILKIKYNNLKTKHENILQKMNDMKTSLDTNKEKEKNIMKELYKLNEHIQSYIISCYKTLKLYHSFENLNNIVLSIIKIFFIILVLVLIFAIIISGIRFIYIYRKRKSYELILAEDINYSSLKNINNSESEKIKKKEKKHKKISSKK
jgi:hypothetical protein